MLNNFNRSIILILLAAFIGNIAKAQALLNSSQDDFPMDKSIRYGKLSNGFTYYIKPLNTPQEKLNMSLYVKAGLNQQDADQLDVAHAVEHLAFTATDNFPDQITSEKKLEKLGMHLYDINGSSGRNTQYQFDVPVNNESALETGLLWFLDIAQGLQFSKNNVEKIRGELRQEFLGKHGDKMESTHIKSKMRTSLFPWGEDNTNYVAYNKSFPSEVLRRFYQDWYRPDLMAVSIVGNVKDLDDLEKKIKEKFSRIEPKIEAPKYEQDFKQYLKRPSQFIKIERNVDSIKGFTDKLVETHLFFRKMNLKKKNSTWSQLKEERIWQLFASTLQERLKDKGQGYINPYSSSAKFPFKSSQLASLPALVIEIKSEDNGELRALKETMKVFYQLKKHGITEKELEGFKNYNELDSESTRYWETQIKNHYTFGEPLPENKNIRLKNWIQNLSLHELNEAIDIMFSNIPEDIALIASKDHVALSYTEKEIRKLINTFSKDTIAPYHPPKKILNLYDQGKLASLNKVVIKEEKTGESGLKEYILENGLKIVLKPFKPTYKGEKIMIKGFSQKGASCFPEEDFYSAINSPLIIRNSGFGTMDKFEIDNFLSSTGIFQGPISYVDYNESVIQGKVKSLKDLEILLKMIYLYFTSPRQDKLAFKDWQKEVYRRYLNPEHTSQIYNDFSNSVRDLTGDPTVAGEGLFGFKFLSGTEKFKGMQKTDHDKAYEIYNKLFGNASDFTFFISGDFNVNSVLPLLQKYLGGLSNKENFSCKKEQVSDFSLPIKNSLVEIKPPGKNSMEGMYYYLGFLHNVDHPKDWKEDIKVEALGWYIYQEVMKLRFEKDFSIYSFGSDGKFNKELNRYEIFIKLFGKKNELALLRKECRKIIAEIKAGKIDNSTFSSSRPRLFMLYSADESRSIRERHNRLYNFYRNGHAFPKPSEVENFVKSINKEDLIETANKYCQKENLMEIVMKK